jgi:hypothetical protein
MRKHAILFCGGAVITGALGAASAYGAIGLPDAESCSIDGNCLAISNTSSGSSSIGILSSGLIGLYGSSTSASGTGVVGHASGTGSEGVAGTGIQTGVHGSGNNGVLGQTTATSGIGVYGQSFGGTSFGVKGDASGATSYGVYGTSSQYVGVFGSSGAAASYGVYGSATGASATGVYGDGGFRGVYAHGNGYGIYAEVPNGTSAKALYGRVTPVGAGYALYAYNPGTATGQWAGYFDGRIYVTGNLSVAGTPFANQTTFSPLSDGRLKKNVEPLTGALDELMKLRGVTFEWKDPAAHDNQIGRQRGFIAQDVEKAIPEWVIQDPEGFKRLRLLGFEAVLVESIRTLKKENNALSERVKALEAPRIVASAGLNGNGLYAVALAILASTVIATRRRQERRE